MPSRQSGKPKGAITLEAENRDYRQQLTLDVKELAKQCGINYIGVAKFIGLDSVRNLNYWAKGEKDGKPFFPSDKRVGELVKAKQALEKIDRLMDLFPGGRKAALQKKRW